MGQDSCPAFISIDFAQLVKIYGPTSKGDLRRYSPSECLGLGIGMKVSPPRVRGVDEAEGGPARREPVFRRDRSPVES